MGSILGVSLDIPPFRPLLSPLYPLLGGMRDYTHDGNNNNNNVHVILYVHIYPSLVYHVGNGMLRACNDHVMYPFIPMMRGPEGLQIRGYPEMVYSFLFQTMSSDTPFWRGFWVPGKSA